MMPQYSQGTEDRSDDHTQGRPNGQPPTHDQTHGDHTDTEPTTEVTPAAPAAGTGTVDPIMPAEAAERLRTQWHDAQGGFVDDPSAAVTATRRLLSEAAQLVTAGIAERGTRNDTTASTEDLRQELRRYRQLFDHLVTI